jgi:hypothetical protein
VVFEAVEPGRRFLERSAMLTQRVWQHERVIEPCPHGCRVTDRVCFEPRLPGLGSLFVLVFKAVFHWRHRNLRRLFGQAGPQADAVDHRADKLLVFVAAGLTTHRQNSAGVFP